MAEAGKAAAAVEAGAVKSAAVGSTRRGATATAGAAATTGATAAPGAEEAAATEESVAAAEHGATNPHFVSRKDGQSGSEVVFGGVDPNHYTGQINWVPVTQQGYWQILVDSVTIDGEVVACNGGCQAIVDTGTSQLVGPSGPISRIQQYIGATEGYYGQYSINCNNLPNMPDVVFTINGIDYPLSPSAYTIQGQHRCSSGFGAMSLPGSSGELWILGDVFIGQYYSIFDRGNNQMGFAQAA